MANLTPGAVLLFLEEASIYHSHHETAWLTLKKCHFKLLMEKESLSPLSPWRVSLFSTLSLSCLEAHILQLHDGYIVAGPECGVNPSPGRGCWGNGWSLPSWENGNWWPLPKSLGIASNWFSTRDLNQFQISNIFFLPCVSNGSRIIPRKVLIPVHSSSAHRFHWVFFSTREAEDSVEVWKIIENSRRSWGAPAGRLPRGWSSLETAPRCHEW